VAGHFEPPKMTAVRTIGTGTDNGRAPGDGGRLERLERNGAPHRSGPQSERIFWSGEILGPSGVFLPDSRNSALGPWSKEVEKLHS
jgi:hypothetical protein